MSILQYTDGERIPAGGADYAVAKKKHKVSLLPREGRRSDCKRLFMRRSP